MGSQGKQEAWHNQLHSCGKGPRPVKKTTHGSQGCSTHDDHDSTKSSIKITNLKNANI